ncbi:MAG: NAD(P)/FAD-dependent oxidoreductase [Candidimonas sp.]|nr:MAG: NAD(P)/FAD-dependent oxidoreductase [Candidimonas sp.]
MACDVIVVGEGVAGLACAGELAAAGLKVATFEADFLGGLVTNVNELTRFERAGGMSGIDYAGTLALANRKAGVHSISEAIDAICPLESGFEVATASGKHAARFIVLASGARLKRLGIPGEDALEGRGVSWCADCDAPLFTDADTIIAGCGQWAVQDALLLARDCATVHMMCGGAAPDATPDALARLAAEPKIHVHADTTVVEVLGNDSGMTGARVRGPAGGESKIAATGLFVMTGLEANSGIAPAGAQRDPDGRIIVNEDTGTAVPGLWAIGQVRAGFGGWLEDALTDAKRAAAAIRACAAQ